MARFFQQSSVSYRTTDLFQRDVDFPGEDIQCLGFADCTFDLVICNHVLEHVPDDKTAVNELARILREGGIGLFTIPGDYSRPKTVFFRTLKHNGHYRHYGLDVLDILGSTFGTVNVIDLREHSIGGERKLEYGIRRGDLLFVCKK